MRNLRWLVPVALVAALGAGAAAQSAPAPAAAAVRSSCSLGTASPLDRATEAVVLGRARRRFERSLTGVGRSARTAAGSRFVTDLAAYLYGYPIVIVRRTILSFPRNQLVSIGVLAGPRTQSIVAPNHDTLYSVAQIDLSAGPIVIRTPPTGGRYSVIQLTDSFTNVAAYLGDGAAARTGEVAAVVPPGWHGTLPAGLRVVRPVTRLVWLLGRTLATGTADTAAAVRLLAGYSVTPLPAYLAGRPAGPLILPAFPARRPVTVPAGAAFFDQLGADLAADAPPARDACAIRAFARVGIGARRTPSRTLSGLSARTLVAAARAGRSVLHALVAGVRHEPSRVINGWATTPPDTARFGTDYAGRAVVAAIGLGANTNVRALYLTDDRDSAGRPLNGNHPYTLRFAPGQLPPVKAFWSVTLYDRRILFYPNRLGRYSLGDRSAGLNRGAHGGLTIVVSHRAPAAGARTNWLPAPAGPFSLYLRLYEPRPAARQRRWRPPLIVRSAPPGLKSRAQTPT